MRVSRKSEPGSWWFLGAELQSPIRGLWYNIEMKVFENKLRTGLPYPCVACSCASMLLLLYSVSVPAR
jgi:hypothetical protein